MPRLHLANGRTGCHQDVIRGPLSLFVAKNGTAKLVLVEFPSLVALTLYAECADKKIKRSIINQGADSRDPVQRGSILRSLFTIVTVAYHYRRVPGPALRCTPPSPLDTANPHTLQPLVSKAPMGEIEASVIL